MREIIQSTRDGLRFCEGLSIDHFMAAVVLDRFDDQMRDKWNTHTAGATKLPKIQEISDFFTKLEFSLTEAPSTQSTNSSKSSKPTHNAKPEPGKKSDHQTSSYCAVNQVTTARSFTCPACGQENHPISRCETFRSCSPDQRQKAIKDAKFCFNCLGHTHTVRDCISYFTCHTCGGKHHTLLHKDSSTPPAPTTNTTDSVGGSVMVASSSDDTTTSLLSTALFKARNGDLHQSGRVLLDSGSQHSFITEKMATNLKLKRRPNRAAFSSMNGNLVSKYIVDVNLGSIHATDHPEEMSVSCHVVRAIPTAEAPLPPSQLRSYPCIKGKTPLADPSFGGKVDVLLGMSDWLRCQTGARIDSPDRATAAWPTIFGWTLGGGLPAEPKPGSVMFTPKSDDHLDLSLQRLFSLDQTPDIQPPQLSPDEEKAVTHFKETHHILPDGRFCVQLPRHSDPPALGVLRPIALKRFLQNERSLKGALPPEPVVITPFSILPQNRPYPIPIYPPRDIYSREAGSQIVRGSIKIPVKSPPFYRECFCTRPNKPPGLLKVPTKYHPKRISRVYNDALLLKALER